MKQPFLSLNAKEGALDGGKGGAGRMRAITAPASRQDRSRLAKRPGLRLSVAMVACTVMRFPGAASL